MSSRFLRPLLLLPVAMLLGGCHGSAPANRAPSLASGPPPAVTLSSPKIATAAASLARRVRLASGGAAAAALSNAIATVNARGEIEVYVHVARVAPAVAAALGATGARITGASPELGIYQVWATPAVLDRLAALAVVTHITLPAYARTESGQSPP